MAAMSSADTPCRCTAIWLECPVAGKLGAAGRPARRRAGDLARAASSRRWRHRCTAKALAPLPAHRRRLRPPLPAIKSPQTGPATAEQDDDLVRLVASAVWLGDRHHVW